MMSSTAMLMLHTMTVGSTKLISPWCSSSRNESIPTAPGSTCRRSAGNASTASQISHPNTRWNRDPVRWKALDEIYTINIALHFGIQSGNHVHASFPLHLWNPIWKPASSARKTLHRRRNNQTAATQRGLEERDGK